MALIGFMLSVFRTGDAIVDKDIALSKKQGGIVTWHDGKLTINFNMKDKQSSPSNTQVEHE